jgi:hypothetical protein
MSIEQIKNKIVDGIKYATEKVGFKLIEGEWGSKEEMCGCALSCMLIANDHGIAMDDAEQNEVEAAHVLGVSTEWVENFISGFDNDIDTNITDEEAFKLGHELRDQFKPVKKLAEVD